ncbi:uncharacterized protein F5891DRAFT_1194649 [Suillus fuscotomentosus]|uniref:Uncharacterized protein n=1 Tax=Suillus fuscotomentosus TaxID=1912939 RepID=A0AAD4DVM1_9AGAM|nr:uncharacterized protein F5891DRAFT_1194649 [Suillus fuscotomentosus]KAG1894983.1 hypothetical protein F5891DRAFT_1194649 [Suillus fuscotomentosus]
MFSEAESNAAFEVALDKMQGMISEALKMEDLDPRLRKLGVALAIELSSAMGAHGRSAILIPLMVLSIAAEVRDATNKTDFLRPINW